MWGTVEEAKSHAALRATFSRQFRVNIAPKATDMSVPQTTHASNVQTMALGQMQLTTVRTILTAFVHYKHVHLEWGLSPMTV